MIQKSKNQKKHPEYDPEQYNEVYMESNLKGGFSNFLYERKIFW